ncbi:hypothetical protein Aperf_G00000035196 [Anoplocephala perfoliata]
MEAGFILDTGGNEGTALKDEDSDNEPREKNRFQQSFRRSHRPELRKALGLSRHDIPLHIYRMRSMGYPPGWLRKAKVEQLPSFDQESDLSHNREVAYNEDALIAFPGFNVYSSKLLEKCREFNCPRIQTADLLENFIASLKKTSKTGDFSRYKQSLESKDLSDLKGERQRILSEINALKSSMLSFSPEKSGGDGEIVTTQGSEDAPCDRHSPGHTLEISIDVDPPEDRGEEESYAEHRLTDININEEAPNSIAMVASKEQVDLVSVGNTTIPAVGSLGDWASATESLTSTQTVSKLPSLDAFSSGIQPYEPYENPPNTQGGYNRVRDLLKRLKNRSDNSNHSVIEGESSSSKAPEPLSSSSQTQLPEGSSHNQSSKSRSLHSSPRVDHRTRPTSGGVDNYKAPSEVNHRYPHSRNDRHESSGPSWSDCRGCRSARPRGYARGDYEPVNPQPPSFNGFETRPARPVNDKPLTADEINDFLAHSDDESTSGSDWDDVRREEVEEKGSYIKHQVIIGVNTPSSSGSVLQTTVADVGTVELSEEMHGNLKPPTNDGEKILESSDVRQSVLNKYDQGIHDTLTEAVSGERHVEGEVQQVVHASEQAITAGSDSLGASRLTALQDCDSKRTRALVSLGGASTSKNEYFVAVPTTIRVRRPQISSEIWKTRTRNRRVFSLVQYIREASGNNAANLQTETTVLVGIVGSKMPPRRSRNHKTFSIWRLTDLINVGTGSSGGPNVSLFLFGTVHEKLWKEPEGTVIALLKPKILPPNENGKFAGNSTIDLSITVDSAPFVMILGMSPDLACCAGTTKAGKPCTRLVNKNACRFCDFHVKSAYFAASHSRPGFATKSISKPKLGRGYGSSVGDSASLTKCRGASSLHCPLTIPTSRSQSLRDQNQNAKSSRLSLNMSKLNSAGYIIDSTSSALTTTSRDSPSPSSSGLSNSETAFITSLVRPSRGSLNLLRALEASSASSTKPLNSARRSSSLLPVRTPQPKPDETFATFFADAKHRLVAASAASKPCLGRELQGAASPSDEFVDLGPLSTQPDVSFSLLSKPSFDSALEAARHRAEALVKARGGVESLLKSDREQTCKRISDAVSKSLAKRSRPAPLDQILGPALTTSKENRDPSQQQLSPVARDDEALVNQRRKRREELAKLVSQGSRHCDLAVANEDTAERRLLSRLEARDQIEEKLLNQHEQECQIVTCFNCQYRSLYIGKNCRKEGHKLEYSSGVKRFFACRNCKTRTVTLDRYPNFACKQCGHLGSSMFEISFFISIVLACCRHLIPPDVKFHKAIFYPSTFARLRLLSAWLGGRLPCQVYLSCLTFFKDLPPHGGLSNLYHPFHSLKLSPPLNAVNLCLKKLARLP